MRLGLALGSALLVAACGADAPPASLVSITTVAPGAECATGGTSVQTGVDRNDNGVLDAAEVAQTQVLCRGSDGVAAVVRTDDEPAGKHCAAGGVVIRSGGDVDRDGALDDAEIEQTRYVCRAVDGAPGKNGDDGAPGQNGDDGAPGKNGDDGAPGKNGDDGAPGKNGDDGDGGAPGADGHSSLIRLDVEPGGAHCADGGIAVKSGIDTNRDGALADTEVTSTQYVCSATASLPDPLVRIADEGPGDHCALGGSVIRIGSDLDGDHVLDDDEVSDTQYLCDSTLVGSVAIHDAAGLARLTAVHAITGSVVIDVPGLTALELPVLRSVGGSLSIAHTAAPRIALPRLTAVGGDLAVVDNAATEIALTALDSVTGSLTVSGDPSLLTLHLEALRSVGGAAQLAAPGLALAAPALQSVTGTLSLTGHATADSFVALASAGGLVLDGAFGTVALPALTSIGDVLVAGGEVSLVVGDGLHQLGTIEVRDGGVPTLGLPGVTRMSRLSIHDATVGELRAPSLTTVIAGFAITKAIVRAFSLDALEAIGGQFEFDGGLSVLESEVDGLHFPRLRSTGYLSLDSSKGFADLSFPELVELAPTIGARHDITIVFNQLAGMRLSMPRLGSVYARPQLVRIVGNGLAEVSMPALQFGQDLWFNDTAMTELHLDALTGVNLLDVSRNAVTQLSLPSLHGIGTLQINENPQLAHLDVNHLAVAQRVAIIDNAALTGLGLGALTSADQLVVTGNPHVATCEAQAVAARAGATAVVIHDNDDHAVCP